jgi:hypothetical protein
MPNTFTPLVTAPVTTADTAMFLLKVLPQAEAKPVFEPLAPCASQKQSAKKCTTPSVTLQRQGDVVSGIRIECGCGQVIELACVF